MTHKKTTIDLIRHGEPVGGRAYRGNGIDDPLSEKGWSQMRKAIGDVCHWDHIVTSPLKRCSEFADELAAKHKLQVQIEPRFKEIGFGEWEGKTKDDLQKTNLEAFEAFYRNPVSSRPKGAEHLMEFIARVTKAFDEIMQMYLGKRVLVVAHAGVIRAIITHITSKPPENMFHIKVANAGIAQVHHDHNGTRLASLNSITIKN